MRITKQALYSLVATLNEAFGRPTKMFASEVGEHPTRFSAGYITLDKNSAGYQLEEQLGEQGGVQVLTARLSGPEISLFMQGLMHGARLYKESNVSTR